MEKSIRNVLYGGMIGLTMGLGYTIFALREDNKRLFKEATDFIEEYSINTQPKQVTHIGDIDMNGYQDIIVSDYLGRSFLLFGQKDGSYFSLEEAENRLHDCPSELEEFRNRVGENILVKAILTEKLNKKK